MEGGREGGKCLCREEEGLRERRGKGSERRREKEREIARGVEGAVSLYSYLRTWGRAIG